MGKEYAKVSLAEHVRLVEFEKEICKGNTIVSNGFFVKEIYTRDESILELTKNLSVLEAKIKEVRQTKLDFIKDTSVAKFIKLKFNL